MEQLASTARADMFIETFGRALIIRRWECIHERRSAHLPSTASCRSGLQRRVLKKHRTPALRCSALPFPAIVP
jgi:hypothetical protein